LVSRDLLLRDPAYAGVVAGQRVQQLSSAISIPIHPYCYSQIGIRSKTVYLTYRSRFNLSLLGSQASSSCVSSSSPRYTEPMKPSVCTIDFEAVTFSIS